MLGALYSIGRAVYGWAAAFFIAYSFIGSIVVYMLGDYAGGWMPDVPATSVVKAVLQVGDWAKSMVTTVGSAAAALGGLAVASWLVAGGYSLLGYGIRAAAIAVDMYIVTSLIQFTLSASAILNPIFGTAFGIVFSMLGALLATSLVVYLVFWATGTAPP